MTITATSRPHGIICSCSLSSTASQDSSKNTGTLFPMHNRARALSYHFSANVCNAEVIPLRSVLALHAVSALLGVLFKWTGVFEDTRRIIVRISSPTTGDAAVPKSMRNYRAMIGGFFLLLSVFSLAAVASPAPQQSDYKTTTCYASSRPVAASSCASLAPAGRWRLVTPLTSDEMFFARTSLLNEMCGGSNLRNSCSTSPSVERKQCAQ